MQHVELVDRELRQRAAGRAVLVPAPRLRRQFERTLVGEVRLEKCDAPQFAGVDFFLDHADAGHQPRAVADRHADAVLLLERGDPQAIDERVRDRLFRVHVLARFGDHLGHRQMLLVRHGENDALNFRIGEQRCHVRRGGHTHFRGERVALLGGAAEARDDLQFVGFFGGARQHAGPAAETDDADFYGIAAHAQDRFR